MRGFLILSITIILFGNNYIFHTSAQECLSTRLEIGDEAQVTPGAANRIRSQPDTSSDQVGQIPAGERMTLLEGSQCVGGFLWWRINYDGVEGWTVEASATDYFLEPVSEVVVTTAAPTNAQTCTTETQLQIDGYGQPSSTTPSRLRDNAGTSAEQVGQVDPIDIFLVIDGPICADGFNWWQVEVNDLVGWLAEGDGDNYFVEPVTDPELIPSTPIHIVTTYAASWNADGSQLALATENAVLIYNTDDWLQEPYLLDNGIIVTDLAFSPTDPNLLVVNGTFDTLFRFRAYDLADEEETLLFELASMDGPMGGDLPAYNLAFSADGSQLGFGGSSFEIFDTDTWERVTHLEILEEAGNHFAQVRIFHSDLNSSGNYGAGVITDEIVQLFDFTIEHTSSVDEDDPRISIFDRGGRTEDITALQFSPDGTQLITGDNTGSLQMWDVETGDRTSFIRADNQASISNRIEDIAFHPDGETIATAESDPNGIVRIFTTEELDSITVFGTNEAHTNARIVSYSPDGEWLLTVMDNTIYVLDTENYSVISEILIWQP